MAVLGDGVAQSADAHFLSTGKLTSTSILENLSVEYVGLILRKEDRSTNKAIKKKANSHFCKFFATYRNFKANNTS
jgi:hypothetical protein